jgi:hypothetical protein
MRNNEIDKILSIIDNLFGEDDNAALPSNWEMSVGRGVGDQHMMARPEYTCINIEAQSTVTTSEIELLEEMLAELNQDGAELTNCGPSMYETLNEFLSALTNLRRQRNELEQQIDRLRNRELANSRREERITDRQRDNFNALEWPHGYSTNGARINPAI